MYLLLTHLKAATKWGTCFRALPYSKPSPHQCQEAFHKKCIGLTKLLNNGISFLLVHVQNLGRMYAQPLLPSPRASHRKCQTCQGHVFSLQVLRKYHTWSETCTNSRICDGLRMNYRNARKERTTEKSAEQHLYKSLRGRSIDPTPVKHALGIEAAAPHCFRSPVQTQILSHGCTKTVKQDQPTCTLWANITLLLRPDRLVSLMEQQVLARDCC